MTRVWLQETLINYRWEQIQQQQEDITAEVIDLPKVNKTQIMKSNQGFILIL